MHGVTDQLLGFYTRHFSLCRIDSVKCSYWVERLVKPLTRAWFSGGTIFPSCCAHRQLFLSSGCTKWWIVGETLQWWDEYWESLSCFCLKRKNSLQSGGLDERRLFQFNRLVINNDGWHTAASSCCTNLMMAWAPQRKKIITRFGKSSVWHNIEFSEWCRSKWTLSPIWEV